MRAELDDPWREIRTGAEGGIFVLHVQRRHQLELDAGDVPGPGGVLVVGDAFGRDVLQVQPRATQVRVLAQLAFEKGDFLTERHAGE